jgi:hypothetical protein
MFNKINCLLGKHKYKIIREISPTIRELKCINCGKEFAMNDNIKCILPLDNELKELNNCLLENRY